MKKTILSLAFVALLPLFVALTCNPSQQKVAFNSIASVEQTATAAVNSYYALVINGKVPTNNVPTVSRAYNDLQASVTLAATISEAGTNALAPAALSVELNALLNLITTAERH